MISDDDVMLLFEQADPARRPDRVNDRVDGAGYLVALRQRSVSVTLTESTRTQPTQETMRQSRRWAWAGAAAAAAIAIVGGAVLLARDDGPPRTTLDPPPSTAPLSNTEPSAAENAAEQFVGAVNERDLVSIEALSTDGLTVVVSRVTGGALRVEELPSLMAWYDAFGWRWEEATCEASSVGVEVECELFERNRLTDLTGAERPATASFAMTDGQIESMTVFADLSDYSHNAFEPFVRWVQSNHPDDVTRMWSADGPILTPESAALFDQHLTEYTVVVEAEHAVDQFVGAFNERDLAAIEALSTDVLTVAVEGVTGDALRVEELPSLMAWYDAFDWRWEEATCEASSVGVEVECELFERNRLTELTGAERPATASFAMTDGQIESATLVADLSGYSPNAFEPFVRWVQSNHPDDVTRMWSADGPILTAESAALFDQHLTGYIGDFQSATGQ